MPSSHVDSQALEQEAALRRAMRSSLREWAKQVINPLGLSLARHHLRLIDELTALSRGEIDRLMVLMPPGSAKSTYVSVIFPAWWFTQHPSSSIIAASHTSELAEHFGRQVRALIAEHGERLGGTRWQGTTARRPDGRPVAKDSIMRRASAVRLPAGGPISQSSMIRSNRKPMRTA
jgi:hypothetical protein